MIARLELVQADAATTLPAPAGDARPDHEIVCQMVHSGARVIVLGCGDGALMTLLQRTCAAQVRGIDADRAAVGACAARGLAVVEGDIERDLADFPSGGADYAVLAGSLHGVRDPRAVLREAARIAAHVVVSIGNAAHWRSRSRLALSGRAPWPQPGYRCSVRDFVDLARSVSLDVERATPLARGRAGAPFARTLWRANLFAEEAVFLLRS